MSDSNPNHRGHSADVRMTLYLEGRALPISHLGPDFLIVKTPIDHPPTDAEIELVIDGQERRWPVRLHKACPPPGDERVFPGASLSMGPRSKNRCYVL